MSVGFYAAVGRLVPDGSVALLEGPDASFSMDGHELLRILDAIAERRHMVLRERELFPWFYGGGHERPEAGGNHDPRAVLRSIQEIERELTKYPKRYGGRWQFERRESAVGAQRIEQGVGVQERRLLHRSGRTVSA
jgi:hypothetical protein